MLTAIHASSLLTLHDDELREICQYITNPVHLLSLALTCKPMSNIIIPHFLYSRLTLLDRWSSNWEKAKLSCLFDRLSIRSVQTPDQRRQLTPADAVREVTLSYHGNRLPPGPFRWPNSNRAKDPGSLWFVPQPSFPPSVWIKSLRNMSQIHTVTIYNILYFRKNGARLLPYIALLPALTHLHLHDFDTACIDLLKGVKRLQSLTLSLTGGSWDGLYYIRTTSTIGVILVSSKKHCNSYI